MFSMLLLIIRNCCDWEKKKDQELVTQQYLVKVGVFTENFSFTTTIWCRGHSELNKFSLHKVFVFKNPT